jgi:uncharacterized membrane protein YecN with MAPEG domain
MVTGLYAGILALIYVGLSIYVIRFRLKHQVSIGDGGHDTLHKAVRAHGNFAEFVPLPLILILLLEMNNFNPFEETPLYLHGLGILLVLGRCAHVFGVAGENPILLARQFGMMATFLTLIIAAVLLIIQFVTT